MNSLKIMTAVLILFGCEAIYAQTSVLPMYSCENPGVKAITSGSSSSNFLQGIIPSCLVTVYLSGTTTKAPIYKDSFNTPQDNPFKANTNGSIPPTFAATGAAYDAVLSGGIPPNVYQNPITLTGLNSGGGGSSGAVTSVNAQGFNPLTGAIVIACGSGLSCTQSGQTITISTSGSFSINSFTGCGGSFELGFSSTNPTCSATYSSTPNSANITNTENIDSPLVLTTPFTSGTIVGTFTHSTVASTTVTLTAVGSSTQTATQTMTWNPRSFGGVGTAGATSSVTASGTTAVLSTSDVLASISLTATNVGSTYGPFVTSNSNVYLLLIGGSHTFVDTGTGFPFAFNTPTAVTFVNANGVSVSMFLYQSSNPLFGTFNIRVAS